MVDDRTATLVEVGDKALHCGMRTRDGLMVLRAAWKYEYAYPLGQDIPLALPRAMEIRLKPERPRAAQKAPAARRRPAKRSLVTARPVALDEAPTWRTGALAAAIANPY
jgi:hypothetical protein